MEFLRILELAGVLKEQTTPSQARAIFNSLGYHDLKTPQELKAARNAILKTEHPDKAGGNLNLSARVNDAYDVLKKELENPVHDTKRKTPPDDGFPAWQTDLRSSYNGIGRENYTDLNYIKKHIWELSGKSRTEYSILNFDGHYFRESITVFGNPEVFSEMVKAMIRWSFHKPRAIFVQKKNDRDIYLIWLDNTMIDPIKFEHDSFNLNPGNDQRFVRELPGYLEDIKTELNADA